MGLDPRSVMLLGRADGRMSEELLHRADVGSIFKQAARERVAEAVRSCMDAGDRAEALDRSPQISARGCRLGVPAPKEVLGVLARQPAEFRRDQWRQLHRKPHPGFFDAEGKPSIRIERGASQHRSVAPPKTGVEQQQDIASRPCANVRGLGRIAACNLVAGHKKRVDLFLTEGHGNGRVDARQFDTRCGILIDQFLIDTPAKKEANVIQFFSRGPGADFPGSAPTGYVCRLSVHQAHLGKCSESSRVVSDGRRPDVPIDAIRKITIDRLCNRETFGIRSHFSNLDRVEAPNSLIPIRSMERAAKGLGSAWDFSISPDGAVAERVRLPLFCESTWTKMTTISDEFHGANRIKFVHGFCETLYTGSWTPENKELNWRKRVTLKIAIEPTFNSFSDLRFAENAITCQISGFLYTVYKTPQPLERYYAPPPRSIPAGSAGKTTCTT